VRRLSSTAARCWVGGRLSTSKKKVRAKQDRPALELSLSTPIWRGCSGVHKNAVSTVRPVVIGSASTLQSCSLCPIPASRAPAVQLLPMIKFSTNASRKIFENGVSCSSSDLMSQMASLITSPSLVRSAAAVRCRTVQSNFSTKQHGNLPIWILISMLTRCRKVKHLPSLMYTRRRGAHRQYH